MLLPVFPRPVKRPRRVRHVLHPFIAYLGQPEFDRLSLGTGNRLDKTQKRFRIGDIGKRILPSSASIFNRLHFVTDFTSFFIQAVF